MKISMKKDFCGVLNNGPLMVSVGDWTKETFPFLQMKKVVSHDDKFNLNSKEGNTLVDRNSENTEADFFVIPDHVTAYISGINGMKNVDS